MIVFKLIFWPLRLLVFLWYKIRLLFHPGNILVHSIPVSFTNNQPGGLLSLFMPSKEVLFFDYLQLLDLFEKSKTIDTIIIKASHLNLDWVQINIIANRLNRIQASGKKMTGYTEGGNIQCLYLLSIIKSRYASTNAGFITMLPAGESFFIKNTLNKFGIQLETSKAGKFKAGGFETFTRTGYSSIAKKSQSRLIGSFRDELLSPFYKIAIKSKGSRKKQFMSDLIKNKSLLDSIELNEVGFFKDLVNSDQIYNYLFLDKEKIIEEKQNHNFFNKNILKKINKESVPYDNDSKKLIKASTEIHAAPFKDRDKKKLKIQKEKIKEKKLTKYEFMKDFRLFDFRKLHKAALVILEGSIIMGHSHEDPGATSIKSLALKKTFKELEKSSEEVVFLYINSPGGSAEASEILYHSIQSLSKIKPVIAITGPVAASGGYYLACAANEIYTNAFSLLGSIGVIRLRPELSGLYKKMGIKKEKIFQDPTADMFTEAGPLSLPAKKLNQEALDKTYKLFLQRVAKGRGLEQHRVLKMAEGQVFLAEPYINSGMVEENKDVVEVIDYYKQKAQLKKDAKFRFNIYPEIKMNMRSAISAKIPGKVIRAILRASIPGLIKNHALNNHFEFLLDNLDQDLCFCLEYMDLK